MEEHIHRKRLSAQNRLFIVWLLVTMLLLIIAGLGSLRHEHYHYNHDYSKAAHRIQFDFDNWLLHFLEASYALNFTEAKFKDCQTRLLPLFNDLIFNVPELSAIAIIDKTTGKTCATLSAPPNINYKNYSAHLYGPYELGSKKLPAFILVQSIANYQVQLYILKKMFDSHMEPGAQFQRLILYDDLHKKSKIITGHVKSKRSMRSAFMLPLQSIKGYSLEFVPKPFLPSAEYVYQLILLLLLVSGISIALYASFRNFLNRHFSLVTTIKEATRLKLFVPAYQPIICTKTQRIAGVEVLARWQANENKVIMPDVFIETAESSGLIDDLTLQMLEKAFEQCKPLLDDNPAFHLAINVSISFFTHAHVIHKFYLLCETFGIQAKHIVIELTERQLLDAQNPTVINHMRDLKKRGFTLAIDDFGTGHSSINYLQFMPFDVLKIDRQFIHAIGTGAVTEHLNEAIINLAHNLNLTIIAEGVETEKQFKYLQTRAVDYVQGWYFAKAMNYNELVLYLAQEKHVLEHP